MTAGLFPRATFEGSGKAVMNGTVVALTDHTSCKKFVLQLRVSNALLVVSNGAMNMQVAFYRLRLRTRSAPLLLH